MKDFGLVSVIMPNYNKATFIEEAIQSVLDQTYDHLELIIVDDKSTDDSIRIIEEMTRSDSRVRYFTMPENRGVAETRNRAVDEARGRFVAFLDSDDSWLPTKLAIQLNVFQSTGTPLTYGSYYYIDEEGEKIGYHQARPVLDYDMLMKSNSIGNLTVIYDTEVLGKRSFSDVPHEDYVLWLQVLKEVTSVHGISEPLARYRKYAGSLSGNKLKASKWQWHIYRKVENLSFFRSAYYFFHYAVRGLIKHHGGALRGKLKT